MRVRSPVPAATLAMALSLAGCSSSAGPAPTSTPPMTTTRPTTVPPAATAQTASTGALQPQFANPADTVRAFYSAINRRDFHPAYVYLSPAGRPPFASWSAGYRDTRHVAIQALVPHSFRILSTTATFTCAGIRVSARQTNGTVKHYGGFYMLERRNGSGWRIALPGSVIDPDQSAAQVDAASCGANIPDLPASTRPMNFVSVSFANAQDGWVSAQHGRSDVMLHTRDGGKTWSRLPASFIANQMQFLDSRRGWALAPTVHGCVSSIEHTEDGGGSWVSQFQGSQLSSLQFITGSEGWAVETGPTCARQSHVTVIRTTDAGRSWHAVFTRPGAIASVHFGDPTHGWLAVSARGSCPSTNVFATTDRGQTWRRQFQVRNDCLGNIDFVNPNDGWLLVTNIGACSMGGCYDNRLYRTQDGGRRWQLQQRNKPGEQRSWSGPGGFLGAVVFVTPIVGYIPITGGAGVGQGGIAVTRDGGAHWQRRLPFGLIADSVSPIDASQAWALGCLHDNSRCYSLLGTTSAGLSWRNLAP